MRSEHETAKTKRGDVEGGSSSLRCKSLLLLAALLLHVPASCSCGLPKRSPQVAWDTSPQAQIVRLSDPIRFPGIQPTHQDWRLDNHIPEGTLYGDGRFLWVEYLSGEHGISRRVMQGYLSKDEMTGLLQRVVDAEFFTWRDNYAGIPQADGPPSTILDVRLSTMQKSVAVSGAPPKGFAELVALIGSGAGASGQEYAPQRAYLSAYPGYGDQGKQLPSWPARELGLALKDLSDRGGSYVEGPALEFAWRVVNAEPALPLVEDQGEVYLITLLLPNLSNVRPPAP